MSKKNECAKYIINFFLVIQFFLLKNLLKKPYIQKTKTYSVFRSKRKHTKNKKKYYNKKKNTKTKNKHPITKKKKTLKKKNETKILT